MRLFQEKAVGFAELATAVVRKERDIVNLRLLGKTVLGKRCIDTDGD
jgi:hypothetical protein